MSGVLLLDGGDGRQRADQTRIVEPDARRAGLRTGTVEEVVTCLDIVGRDVVGGDLVTLTSIMDLRAADIP